MGFFQYFLIAFIVPILIKAIIESKHNKVAHSINSVCMPYWFFLLGVFGGIVSCIAGAASLFVSVHAAATVTSISFAIVSIVFLLGYFCNQIHYDDELIYVKKIFFVRHYRYVDIVGVELRSNGGYFLITKRGKVHVDGLSVGKEEFLDFVETKYQKIHSIYPIPTIENPLFHGNVIEPEPIAFFLCLPFVLFLILSTFATRECFSVDPPEMLYEYHFVAQNVDKQRSTIIITDGTKEYRVWNDAITNPDALYDAVSQHKPLIAECSLLTENKGNEILGVRSLCVDGVALVTYETDRKAEHANKLTTMAMLWSLTILSFVFAGGSFYVISNATKYPVLASMLIKKDYRNF